MPKILIADDNTNIQRMVALAFEERGIQVVAVGNGEAAVRRLMDLNPDLVLADIFMPVRSGYEVCEYIKKDKNFCHIPVILLVGAFDPLDEKEARRVGADGVLKKPFVPPDPLIAMVTAALEKNPRVAAELAKAREVIAEPPSPPVPEIAARLEPRPLPQFPEPTPEEAALVYGFGSGRHSILDQEKDRESPAPAAEAEEEFEEDAQTTPDWRRAAMDFEVPQEAGGRPAFSDDTAFPSVRQAPAPELAVPQSSGDVAPLVEKKSSEKAGDKFDFDRDAPGVSAESVAAVASMPASFAPSEEIAALAPAGAEHVALAAEPAVQSDTDIRSGAASENSGNSGHSDNSSNVPHWMDALSAVPADRGWVASLSQKQEAVKKPEEIRGAADFQTEAPTITPISDSQSSNGASSSLTGEPAGESWFAAAPAAFDSSREAFPPAPAPLEHAKPEHIENVLPSLALPSIPVPFDVVEDAPGDLRASGREPELDQAFGVRVTPEPLLDSEETHMSAAVSRREMDLVVPPAVHVIPEPLLDCEESGRANRSYTLMEEISPAHSQVAPPATEETEASSNPSAGRQTLSAESFVDEFGGRIPTGPPPNRQALEEIPFLTPPEDFNSSVGHASEESGINSETVDAVVRKVLERLEPQLHELFSEGVLKPLIENMLQGELAKKDR